MMLPTPSTTPAPSPDEQVLRKAIVERPDSPNAHAAFASFLCNAGRTDEALAHMEHEIRRIPASIWPLSIKAGILSSERRAAEALDVHRTLVAMAPGIPLLWANFGGDLAAAGHGDEAARALRRTIALAPGFGPAWLGLANLRVAPLNGADIVAMEDGFAHARNPHHQIQLLFALGRGYGALGAFERSFEAFAKANAMRETLIPHNGARIAAFVEAHRNLRPSLFKAAQDASPELHGAIFIVGMPRSGSTLVEQILSCHPEIEGMGELSALEDVAASMGAFDNPAAFTDRLRSLTQAEAARRAADYLARAGRYRRTARPFFTDKMPANWRFVALIRRIMPSARIIDVRRDPMACGFSAFTTYFNRNTDFPNRLEDLGSYYRSYRQMMEMAQASAPDGMCDVDYERLVSDPDREIPALLDRLRLRFAEACLMPDRNRRAIYTPSAQQVRTPIHRTQDRFRDYLPWLRPLQVSLGAG